MADKKYYSIEEAAGALGITPAEINLRRERNELHGYRDGASWKYKAEEVDALARRLRSEALSAATDDDTGEVLLSDSALGGSEAGISGTVVGGKDKKAADSDLRLADSEVKLGGAGPKLAASPPQPAASAPAPAAAAETTPPLAAPVADDADLDVTMAIDEDLLLDEETPFKPQMPAAKKADSPGDAGGRKLEDDDLVIGGGSSGSDITIGGDSGISLVDPTDSGLSLEEPLELERETPDDSLELGEDDMLTFAEDTDEQAATMMKPEEGFQLTPMEDSSEEESESGSQVIALEGTPVVEGAPTMIASSAVPLGAAAMLDEDFAGSAEPIGLGPAIPAAGSPLGMAQPTFAEGVAGPMPSMAAPEAPYSGWQITALSICVLLLFFCGLMGYELLRNMWSWNSAYAVNSKLMDLIVGLF
jgi:hypothetical protein